MNKRRQLITIDEAVPAQGQHTKPCSDCPWSRKSLPGWLGGESVDAWLGEAHGNFEIPCHTLAGAQCAGAAIYRRNVCKLHVNDGVLILPADRERVFATPFEFKAHHEKTGQPPPTPTETTVMPKADVIAKNMALNAQKTKFDAKMAKVAASHTNKLNALTKKANAAADKVTADFKKVSDLTEQLAKLNAEPLNALSNKIDQRRKKIEGLVAKIRKITGKYTPAPVVF